MFDFVLFIYLFLTFLNQVAEPETIRALENRCLTTVLKIIEKYREEVWIACRQFACNFTKNEHFYKYLSKYVTSKTQLPASKNISWWMLLTVVYGTAAQAGLLFLEEKYQIEKFHFLLRIQIFFKNYVFL